MREFRRGRSHVGLTRSQDSMKWLPPAPSSSSALARLVLAANILLSGNGRPQLRITASKRNEPRLVYSPAWSELGLPPPALRSVAARRCGCLSPCLAALPRGVGRPARLMREFRRGRSHVGLTRSQDSMKWLPPAPSSSSALARLVLAANILLSGNGRPQLRITASKRDEPRLVYSPG